MNFNYFLDAAMEIGIANHVMIANLSKIPHAVVDTEGKKKAELR